MSRLLSLANEMLVQIVASTDVEDIDSFSSCNKHMRLLFGDVLQLHMERKKNTRGQSLAVHTLNLDLLMR